MTQKTYLIKGLNDKLPRLANLKRVSYPPIRKQTGSIGGFPVMSDTGKYKRDIVELSTDNGYLSVYLNKDCVNSKIRKLREQEARRLDEIDAKIAELHKQKIEVLKTAWQKANVVTVTELTKMVTA